MYSKKLLVVGIVLIMTISAMSFVGGDEDDTNPSSDPSPRPAAGTTPRTVLLEDYTATWCPPCTTVAPALSRVSDEYHHDQLASLAWHPTSSEVGSPVASLRASYHGWGYLPTVMIDGGGTFPDGTLWRVGGTGGAIGRYNDYRELIDGELASLTNIKIDLWGSVDSTKANVVARIEATDPITQPDLYVHSVLYEDDLYAVDNNDPAKNGYHRHVVRDYTYHPFDISEGQIVYEDFSFNLMPNWIPLRLGVVVFVQTDYISGEWIYSSATHQNREVLQVAELDFIHEPILLVNDAPNFPSAWLFYDSPWQKMLAYNNYSFDSWDTLNPSETGATNVREIPTYNDIKNYSVVVWFNGDQPSTLDATERMALSQYLNSPGNLFISGINVGEDLNTTDQAFLTNTLHATFNKTDSGEAQIMGITGDPISDQWNSTAIPISALSPDVIEAADMSTYMTFNYTPSNGSAALRSQHDVDSRVVFFGFNYSDGESPTGVPDSTRVQVLEKALDWLLPEPPTSASPEGANITGANMSPDFNNVTLTWSASPDDGGGENDIVEYDIYFGIHYTGPYVYLASEPATGAMMYMWDHVDANTEPFTFFYKIIAKDATDRTASVETAVKFMQRTVSGNNMLSIPVNPSNTSLTSVLQTIDYDMVWAYDPTDPTDPWKSYIEVKPYTDLTQLTNTMGFWVNGTIASELITVGLAQPCTDIPLYTGWNLVSYPSFIPRSVATALSSNTYDRIETFDQTAPPQYLKQIWDPDIMMPGYGYWIKVPSDQIWTVCN